MSPHTASILSPAGRLAVMFVLDVAGVSRLSGDALDTLILTAVLQANQAAVRQDPELQRLYADAATSLPDEFRRPISIHALAQSLRMPFETVRRRVGRLAAARLLAVTPAGLLVPQAVATSAPFRERQTARVERLCRFFNDLAAEGLVVLPRPLLSFLRANPRAADRLLGDYVLRAADRLMRLTGNAQDGAALLALWAGYSARALESERRGGGAVAPFGTSAMAASLGVSLETARRRLRALEALGFAVRTGGGWVLGWPEESLEVVFSIRAESWADLRRLLAGLEALRTPA